MKRFIVPALLLNAILLGLRAWQEHPAHAGTVATANGDTNGDGERDISDALYMLFWLFNGGPEPVALAQTDQLTMDELNTIRSILPYISRGVTRIGPGDSADNFVPAVQITGANLQVVNGIGSTSGRIDFDGGRYEDVRTNGTGNIIIGYNEMPHTPAPIDTSARIGSHNLIIGAHHAYPSIGGIVAGWHNSISAPSAVALGGRLNSVTEMLGAICGGDFNKAAGMFSVVCGGQYNQAEARASCILGGELNRSTDFFSTVVGGRENIASGHTSSVSGGRGNEAASSWSVVGGGGGRTATGSLDWRAGDFSRRSKGRSSIPRAPS